MKQKKLYFSIFYLSIAFNFLSFSKANAYIDPGTGGMILQIIIGGIAAVFVTIKLYWFKLKNFLSKFKNRKKDK